MTAALNPIRRALIGAGLLAGLAGPSTALAETFKIDNTHSAVVFGVKHMGVAYTYGRFNELSGSFETADGEPTGVDLSIKTASVDTHSQKRDDHLRSPDFFNAGEFPTIGFKSKKLEKAGDGWKVTGDLSVHGVTREVTIPVQKVGEGPDPWGGYRFGLHGTTTIQRSDYGMDQMMKAAGDEIKLIISLEGIQEKKGE